MSSNAILIHDACQQPTRGINAKISKDMDGDVDFVCGTREGTGEAATEVGRYHPNAWFHG
jgi:hypothetical protein